MLFRERPQILCQWKLKILFVVALVFGAVMAEGAVPTYTRDVAPILFKHCASCHRPGEAAPFPLLTYDDARRKGKMIAEVTGKGLMPPWMPNAHPAGWIGERRLATIEIATLKSWVDGGMPEGQAGDLPKAPEFADGWQLGNPDLVVTMPKSYVLAAEGKDVYRNFVVPVPLEMRRHVRAVEFRPDNRRLVHHAFIKVDRTKGSRLLEASEKEPGFPGIMGSQGTVMPPGQFLSWQPGHGACVSPVGFPWDLDPGTDLVLQVHLNPTGKPESLQISVGLYFTDRPAAYPLFKMPLVSMAIDIPAGATNHVVEDRFVLPVDVQVLAVLPHAHYLGRQVEGTAHLPDGSTQTLIRIGQWDFDWQTDYKFQSPLQFPKGTELKMRWTFDNSTGRARNPTESPSPVRYGAQSSDEMAELWLQMLCRPADRARLQSAADEHSRQRILESEQMAVRLDPTNAAARARLGLAWFASGNRAVAASHFHEALRLDAKQFSAQFNLGVIAMLEKRADEARRRLDAALEIEPDNVLAHGNMGILLASQGDFPGAERHLVAVLRQNPSDAVATEMLPKIRQAMKARPVTGL